MAWVVDTCMLIDVLEDDPLYGAVSATALDEHQEMGLVVCPVTYVELAPAFRGNRALQDEFLGGIGVDFRQGWSDEDTRQAHGAWYSFVERKRAGAVPKRPLANILIGAFALRYQGLLTRNTADFEAVFDQLTLHSPPLPTS